MNRLKDLREEKDLNQIDVANMLGIGQAGYSKYENGKNNIPVDILIKLSRYYNTSIDYLLYCTDVRKPYKKSILSENKHEL